MASAAPARIVAEESIPQLATASRRAFLGFFLIGVLLAIPGIALPAWNYHLQPPYLAIGFHFLSLAGGVLIAMFLSRFLLRRLGAHPVFSASLLLASLGIVILELSGPPLPVFYRHLAFFLVGLGLGSLTTATFQLLQKLYEQDPAATVNLAGGLMGLGALIPALCSALAYRWTEFSGLFFLLALAPFGCAAVLIRGGPRAETPVTGSGFQELFQQFRSPVHVLFAALLFFETAAELSLTQWAPLHLILRSGMSPSAALYFLSYFCLALLGGRFLAQAIMRRHSHRILLLISAAMSWLGILIFSSTDNGVGAAMGLTLAALGFSFVYPLLVERIGSNFREYHSSLFHGIFGLAMTGGFLAPAVIGFWAAAADESSAMTLPLWCSLLVFMLLLVLWIESKISVSRVARN